MPQFMTYPLNYGDGRTMPVVAGDNDYNTGTTADVVCNIADSTGAAQTFTHIFLKGNLTADVDCTITGGSTLGFSITYNPVLTDDSGDVNPTNPDGFVNILLPTGSQTAQTLTFAPQEATDEIVEVMILNELLSIDSNDRFTPEYDEIPLGQARPGITGRLNYIPPLGNERDKNQIGYRIYFNRSQLSELHTLKRVIRDHKQLTFVAEYERYPELVFPALIFPQPRQQRGLSRFKGGTTAYRFTIREI